MVLPFLSLLLLLASGVVATMSKSIPSSTTVPPAATTSVAAQPSATSDPSEPSYWNNTAHLDLVFPLNDTYTPENNSFPIVFRLPRSQISEALDTEIQYHIRRPGNLLSSTTFAQGIIPWSYDNGTVGNTAAGDTDYDYGFVFTDALIGKTGAFELIFNVEAHTCTYGYNDSVITVQRSVIQGSSQFTIADGGLAPVLWDRSTANTCNPNMKFSCTIQTSDVVPAVGISKGFCVYFSYHYAEVVEPNCAVAIGAAAASSISSVGAARNTAAESASTSPASSKMSYISAAVMWAAVFGVVILAAL
ncbi:hypothetical protein F503_00825 [Ophiostoma piceae UAMH 11346]|uniref:DUF7136 domain-containing protein n=1 Tax=Ophiostoma piceae (strain UAMH 11346) TaxID=1262450 RepID=S3C5G5_OPHP1|nr:hypothetical protein F503_00825 [Ophiostoma piceae UAMH 11346]